MAPNFYVSAKKKKVRFISLSRQPRRPVDPASSDEEGNTQIPASSSRRCPCHPLLRLTARPSIHSNSVRCHRGRGGSSRGNQPAERAGAVGRQEPSLRAPRLVSSRLVWAGPRDALKSSHRPARSRPAHLPLLRLGSGSGPTDAPRPPHRASNPHPPPPLSDPSTRALSSRSRLGSPL
jgi:hypothetical protein